MILIEPHPHGVKKQVMEKGVEDYHLVMTNIAMENHHAINR
jgi:hypothetical protein